MLGGLQVDVPKHVTAEWSRGKVGCVCLGMGRLEMNKGGGGVSWGHCDA